MKQEGLQNVENFKRIMDDNEAQPHPSHSVKHIPVTKLTAIDLVHYYKKYIAILI